MPIRDVDKRRAADRERKRARRHAGLAHVVDLTGGGDGTDAGGNQTVCPTELPDLASVGGIRLALAKALARLDNADLDAIGTARATGSLAGVAVKLLEVGELEERLAALETKLETEGQGHG